MTTTSNHPAAPAPGGLPEVEVDPSIYRHLADAQVNVELDTGDMILNIGPQHPATHGTLRLVVRLDGERVIAADPVIGYMHRGYEKLVEYRTYPQITTLINRIDWLSSFANEVPFIFAAEKLMGIEAPPRARTSVRSSPSCRASRRSCCSSARWACRSARSRPRSTASATREYILNLIEAFTGGRFHPNFNRIGGVKDDVPWGWMNDTRQTMKKVLDSCDDFENLVAANPIFQQRTRSIGIIPGELGAAVRRVGIEPAGERCRLGPAPRRYARTASSTTSSTGRCGRHPDGDSFARYWVRLQETRESARMVLQMLDGLPTGPIMAKVPRIIKVPEGEVWVNLREPPRRDGLLHHLEGRDRPVPGEDPLGVVQQRLDPALAAARRVRSRRDHDPRVALLHPR